MALKLSPPVEETYILEETDAEYGTEGTLVRVRQASQRQHERRDGLYSKMESEFGRNSEVVKVIQHFSYPELQRLEVQLTLVDCNIEDSDGKPLFKFKNDGNKRYLDMSDKEFQEAWGILPHVVADEIHSKVLLANPTWNRLGEA